MLCDVNEAHEADGCDFTSSRNEGYNINNWRWVGWTTWSAGSGEEG